MDKILLVEDKESLRQVLLETLQTEGYAVVEATDGQEAIQRISEERFDLILTDLKLPKKDGLEVLRAAQENSPSAAVVLMTAYGTIEVAVRAMKEGAYDFLCKPIDTDYLLILIERAMERQRLWKENILFRSQLAEKLSLPEILGRSPRIIEAFQLLEKVAPTSATVLLSGESGTGKELFARALHFLSPRRERPFLAINCAAIPENLQESEFFGHEKGAFTGADHSKPGKFELADQGTLFLDEVGDLSLSTQAKLLRVLQGESFERVGGTKSIRVDVRIVAATNQDLVKASAERKFRDDLLYRLHVFPIRLPPLRERPEDIPLLAERFVSRYALEMKKPVKGISKEALSLLQRYSWPGNVRELQNCLERAVILCSREEIQPKQIQVGPEKEEDLAAIPIGLSGSLHEASSRASRAVERKMIQEALRQSKGNKWQAAKHLQVSYKTLLFKIKDLEIEP
ncbi:MAG: sigma-54 dependent transcriptional regulator [candidate division NC10 bacterium]|nr:sigma-54 dependent transcriptional regulator [candidate division NC10 bacterium]